MDLKIKMNLKNNEDLWEKLIYDLQGTCENLDSFLERSAPELIDHLPFLQHLDNQIFCCEQCNWWCELSEMADNDDWECRDCSPDN
jgi:hypothetical protein